MTELLKDGGVQFAIIVALILLAIILTSLFSSIERVRVARSKEKRPVVCDHFGGHVRSPQEPQVVTVMLDRREIPALRVALSDEKWPIILPGDQGYAEVHIVGFKGEGDRGHDKP